MCGQFLESMDENEIYKEWLNNDKNLKKFKDIMCYGTGIQDQCKKESKKQEL